MPDDLPQQKVEGDLKPTLRELLGVVEADSTYREATVGDFPEKAEQGSQKAENAAEKAKIAFTVMRRQWSTGLLVCIAGIVGFDFLFVTFMGMGYWTFTDNNIVYWFIAENLAKIAGLAYIVVKFLFSKDSLL